MKRSKARFGSQGLGFNLEEWPSPAAPFTTCYGIGFISARPVIATIGLPDNTKESCLDRSGTGLRLSSTIICGNAGTGFGNGRRVY